MEERDFAGWAGVPGHAPLMLRELALGRLSHVLPQVAVRVWPGGGHFPCLARPERFARCAAVTAQWGVPA